MQQHFILNRREDTFFKEGEGRILSAMVKCQQVSTILCLFGGKRNGRIN